MVVFLGIQPGQVPEEPQPEGLDPFRDWQAACSASNNRAQCRLTTLIEANELPLHYAAALYACSERDEHRVLTKSVNAKSCRETYNVDDNIEYF